MLQFDAVSSLSIEASQLHHITASNMTSILAFQNSNVTISGLSSSNCGTEGYLRVSDNQDNSSYTTVHGSLFVNTSGTAVMYSTNGNISFYNCTFNGRGDDSDAGAVSRSNNDISLMTVDFCYFGSIGTGGTNFVLSLSNPQLLLTDSTFEQCWSTAGLGMITIDHVGSPQANQTVTIDNCRFWNNQGQYGAFYMLGWSGSSDIDHPANTLNVSNSQFEANYGDIGGAFTAWAVPRVFVVGCMLKGNEAFSERWCTGFGWEWHHSHQHQPKSFFGEHGYSRWRCCAIEWRCGLVRQQHL